MENENETKPTEETNPAPPEEATDDPQAVRQIHVHYIKSTQFRTVHVDGIFGGITPRGLLHLTTYSERPAIPQETDYVVNGQRLAEVTSARQGKKGFVRELDINLIMDLDAARSLQEWLRRHVETLEKIHENGND